MWVMCCVSVRPKVVISFTEGSLANVWAFNSATAKSLHEVMGWEVGEKLGQNVSELHLFLNWYADTSGVVWLKQQDRCLFFPSWWFLMDIDMAWNPGFQPPSSFISACWTTLDKLALTSCCSVSCSQKKDPGRAGCVCELYRGYWQKGLALHSMAFHLLSMNMV